MKNELNVRIISPGGVLLNERVDYVNLPAADGSIGILPGHSPLIAQLVAGDVKYRKDGAPSSFGIPEGLAKVADNTVTVIVGAAE